MKIRQSCSSFWLSRLYTVIISTHGNGVLSSSESFNTNQLAPCHHEEADLRLILHLVDMALKGSKKIMLRTVETDVLVLTVAFYSQIHADELWVAFGTGKNLRFIAVQSIVNILGESKAKAFPLHWL